MTAPLSPASRATPAALTRATLLPPSMRSRAALGLTAAAALGRFRLQVCAACQAVQYPPRETCYRCLSDRLRWQDQSGAGELISETNVRHSQNAYFQERLPWRIGMVRLDAGPTLIVHVHGGCAAAPSRVRATTRALTWSSGGPAAARVSR